MTVGQHRRETAVAEQWDRVFEAVAAEPRRRLVRSLAAAPPGDSVPALEAAGATTPVDRDRLRRHLYHRHLPLLADAGYVEWETEPLVARRGPRFDEVAAVLEALRANATAMPPSLADGCRWLERDRD